MASPYFTIGHSNRTSDAFVALLKENGIEVLADIRSIPRSRYNAQFNGEVLHSTLAAHGIAYHHLPLLGGLRGDYTAYMQTPDFKDGIAALAALHETGAVAFMCAEAKWQDCHRRFVTDYLLENGNEVRHIVAADKIEAAQLSLQASLF